MDNIKRKTLTLLFACLFAAGAAHADRLLIEKVESTRDAQVPRHGQTMDQVESSFGAPANKVPAVGEPPITRWVYPGFTVYFEHEYVIDSVIHTETGDQQA